jgi:hypothetical protein
MGIGAGIGADGGRYRMGRPRRSACSEEQTWQPGRQLWQVGDQTERYQGGDQVGPDQREAPAGPTRAMLPTIPSYFRKTGATSSWKAF